MRIHAFTISWNEELRLPWFLEHYWFCERIFLFDNYSTDRTLDIARTDKRVQLNRFGQRGLLENNEFLRIKNQMWKGSDADWVVVCDVDEHVWHPDLLNYLGNTSATVLRPARAWGMVSREFKHYRSIYRGFDDANYRKMYMFKPSAIAEINYAHGAHVAEPTGEVRLVEPDGLVCYHYHYVGQEQTLERRHVQNARRSREDIEAGWAIHYAAPDADVIRYFDLESQLKDVKP